FPAAATAATGTRAPDTLSPFRAGPRPGRGVPCPQPLAPHHQGPAMSKNVPSAADLELLRRFDTPTVCNVIELFDVRPRHTGYLDGRIQACYPRLPPMVGYAATATFRSAAPPRAGNVYAGLSAQVSLFGELPGPALRLLSGPGYPGRRRHIWLGHVYDLQGLRRRWPHY